jgi:hypothetical protein
VNVLVPEEKDSLEAMAVLFFLVLGQNPEQQFGAARLQLHMAELVNAEKIDASVAGNDLGQLLLVGRLDELVDEFGGPGRT